MLNAAAKKWVEALRSDRFKQAKGWLCDGDGYCCLGVACVLAEEEGVIETFLGNGVCLVNYPKVKDWLNLQTTEGKYYPADTNKHYSFLTNDNDRGKSFKEIADIIESEPRGLFGD